MLSPTPARSPSLTTPPQPSPSRASLLLSATRKPSLPRPHPSNPALSPSTIDTYAILRLYRQSSTGYDGRSISGGKMQLSTSRWVRIVIALSIVLFTGQKAFAQFGASLQGTVEDSGGNVVPGASVTITNNNT